MKAIHIRSVRKLLAGLLLAAALPLAAQAQNYPTRTMRLIFAFPAGSAVHSSMMLLAQEATKQLGQPMIVEVKPGAGGRIGLNEGIRSPADGYTLTQASYAMLVLQGAVDPRLRIDPGKDYSPIIATADLPYVLVGHPSLPFRDVKGFLAYVKANPGKLNVSGSPVLSDSYFGLLRMKSAYNLDFTVVPFKGSADGVPAQLERIVDVSVINGIVKQHVDSGKMIGMATTAAQRWDLFPSLPTLIESGIDMTIGTVSGVVAPPGTPAPIITRLNQVFARTMAQPEVKAQFVNFGLVPRNSTPEEYTRMIRAEQEVWPPIIQKAGIKPESN